MSRPEREAAERARRAWIIENDPNFAALDVRTRQEWVYLWDKRFPPPSEIESPAAREKRIAELARRMKLDAFRGRELALERTKEESMVKPKRDVARQPGQPSPRVDQSQQHQPSRGPSKDYDWYSR